jgi:hypothetical protein
MKIIHHDLGFQNKGSVVVITLSGDPANVRLLDQINYEYYLRGKSNYYVGATAATSQLRLTIPYAGNWHVVVDLKGLIGTVTSSVKIL